MTHGADFPVPLPEQRRGGKNWVDIFLSNRNHSVIKLQHSVCTIVLEAGGRKTPGSNLIKRSKEEGRGMKRMIGGMIAGVLLAAGTVMAVAPGADAAGVTYSDGDKYVKIGGRIQIQYHSSDTDGGDTTDELFFRRLRPYVEGSVHRDWKGKIQFDLGKSEGDDEVSIKDAYLQYKGFKDVEVTVGNAYFPFSREALTSSKKQQLVERTFVGDHNYGTPDRNLGVHLAGELAGGRVTWAASVASASIDPGTSKLDFDTPVNKDADFLEGWIYGGRVDFHPFGKLKLSQGDFDRDKLKATVGVAAFGWNNDGDNNTGAASDVENVAGFEVSGGARYMGASVDAEYNIFNADTVDDTTTSGIYRDGTTELRSFSVEGGYMVVPSRLEIVGGYECQDADNYTDSWTRTSFGANWFFREHDIKAQATYRIGKNIDGTDGNDVDEVFVQAQYVF